MWKLGFRIILIFNLLLLYSTYISDLLKKNMQKKRFKEAKKNPANLKIPPKLHIAKSSGKGSHRHEDFLARGRWPDSEGRRPPCTLPRGHDAFELQRHHGVITSGIRQAVPAREFFGGRFRRRWPVAHACARTVGGVAPCNHTYMCVYVCVEM